mgnify:CR=1 FL=1
MANKVLVNNIPSGRYCGDCSGKESMSNVVYAIPTYNRPHRQKTLEYLLANHVEHVILFVQNRYEEYEERYGNNVQIVRTKADSVASNRNCVLNYLQGHKVVMLDDDISIIHELDEATGTWRTQGPSFFEFAEKAFDSAEKEGAEAWGLYPTHQPFYMRGAREKFDYAILIGTVLGLFAGERRFDEQFRVDEDFDFCMRILLDGKKVVRYNRWAADAAHRTRGGCQDDWAQEEQYAKMLEAKYPLFVKYAPEKKSKIRVVRFQLLEELLHPSPVPQEVGDTLF